MADNLINEGKQIFTATADGLTSGEPFVLGNHQPCVLLTDAAAASPYNATVQTYGVFDLPVEAEGGAINIYDPLFYDATDKCLNDDGSNNKFFGVALEAVESAATETIKVFIVGKPYVPASITATELANEAVTLAKMADLARGSIISGQTAGDRPTALDAKGDAKILVGNGTDLASVSVSGDVTITNAGVVTIGAQKIKQTMINDSYTYETFNVAPVCMENDGTAPSGTAAATNIAAFERNTFEYFMIGTQSLLVPTIAADGLLASLDLTNNEGVEYSQGITARSRSAFTIGTSAAFYMKVGLKVADVSGSDICAVGFRKADQAYQAAFADYTDKATLNKVAGDIYITTALNNNADVATDTTDDWADGETHVLEVYVSGAGAVTYKIDGVAPTVTAALTFDTGDVVVPFLHILHDVTDPGAIHITQWEVGLQ